MEDVTRFMETFRSRLEAYRKAGHITRQIDVLRNLAVIAFYMGNKIDSMTFLTEAEQLLFQMDESHIAQICAELGTESSVVAADFVRSRSLMIKRVREKVDGDTASDETMHS
jgi:hypothetical protein